jgi:hypothetical protein
VKLAAAILIALARTAAADPIADQLAAIPKLAPGCDAARAHCFGIQIHVAPAADGSGLIVTPAWLAEQVAEAEKHFTPLDAGFVVVGADVLADKRTAHLETRKDRDALAVATGLGGRVIHVYITGKLDDVDIAGSIAYGVTWHTKDDRKFIIVSGMALPRTLAHELGHFFGLPHSTYAISIMNKTKRKEPPREQRTFADVEIEAMKPVLARLVKDGVIADRAKP